MTKNSALIYPDGSTVKKADIARVKYRASIEAPTRSGWAYDASSMIGPELGDWWPYNQSPDMELNYTTDIIRARQRDLIRNNGWATGTIQRTADSMVGPAFNVVPQPNWRWLQRKYGPSFDAMWAAEFRAEVISEYRMFANDPDFWCDAQRSMSVNQIFYMAAKTKVGEGENLLMPLWMPENVGFGAARFNTALQLIDPDRLSNPFNHPDTHNLRGGIEVSDSQAPIAYHIRRAHPNGYYDASMSMIWDRFERSTAWGRPLVIHDCDRDRISQHRGTGILTPVLSRFRMLAKYDQAALQAALMRTLVGFFIKSPMDVEQVKMAMELGGDDRSMPLSAYEMMRNSLSERDNLRMNGVHMPVLGPGESIEVADARGEAEDFNAFEHTFLRSIAAATGESAEEVTKDYTQTNYSSARAALISAWRRLLVRRADFASGTATPVYSCILEEIIDRPGGLTCLPHGVGLFEYIESKAAWVNCTWIGPGKGWIDPVKEREGELLGLDAGFGTLSETCASVTGANWQDVLDQRAVEEAYLKKLGLTRPQWAAGVPAQQVEKPQ